MPATGTGRANAGRVIDFQQFVKRRRQERLPLLEERLPLFESTRTDGGHIPAPARALGEAQVAHRERMLRFLGGR